VTCDHTQPHSDHMSLRADVQVRENTEPEDAIQKMISGFEEGSAGRSKEAEAARAAAVAAAEEVTDAEAAAAAVAEAMALTDRKARIEALKKAAGALPSPIVQVNGREGEGEGGGGTGTPVDAAHMQTLQAAAAVIMSENEAAAKAVAENRENVKPQLVKWATDLDARATKCAASDIDKVAKGSLAQRNAFRQAAAVYAQHLSAVVQALAQVLHPLDVTRVRTKIYMYIVLCEPIHIHYR